jgi:hypothetical protein
VRQTLPVIFLQINNETLVNNEQRIKELRITEVSPFFLTTDNVQTNIIFDTKDFSVQGALLVKSILIQFPLISAS